MKIAVIGAGFTGLSAAFNLSKSGHKVTVFEKDSYPGGLAIGFREPEWDWSLEKHYHHWFTNDKSSLDLAKEINYEVLIKRPKTSVYVDKNIYQLDSPLSVLKFSCLSIMERLRMAAGIGLIRYNPFWKPLEKMKASQILPLLIGKKSYIKIWEPLLISKFGKYIDEISMAWLWARIAKRTPSLAYPQGGFLEFANALVDKIREKGGEVLFNTEVKEIKSNNGVELKFEIENSKLKIENYDKTVVTLPSFYFMKIAPGLTNSYKNGLMKLKGLGAINLVLRLKKQFLTDGTYWLNICDKSFPIMAIVEHTNFMDKKNYNNEHLVYLGNYLPHDHPYMKMTENELLKIYDPYLRKINPSYRSSLISSHLFKVPFAQPIIPVNYSKIIPPFKTPLNNVYLANIQQVYPWDRGTNYAIELGEKVAQLVIKDY